MLRYIFLDTGPLDHRDEVSGSKFFELVHIFDMVKFVRKLEFLLLVKKWPKLENIIYL